MANEDQPVTDSPSKGSHAGPPVWLTLGILAVVGLLFTMLAMRGGEESSSATTGNALEPSSSAQTATTINEQDVLVDRLQEILARRENAYRERNERTLQKIYTVDCPCLQSDSNAIRELRKQGYIWVGGETSIKVRRVERVSARMWTIVADFSSAPLRIETESGRLVRGEPGGNDLFQFVLVMPTGSTEWLLGRAASFESG